MQKIFQIVLCTFFIIPCAYSDELLGDSSIENGVISSDVQQANDCCLPIKLSAELLYFKPGIEQSSYAITSISNAVGGEFFPSGKRHHNRANYKPGFRIEGKYDLCCSNAIDGRFTYFRAGHSDSASGDFLFDTIGYPGEGAQAPEDTRYSGTARIHDRYRYYAGDLTFNRLSLCSCVDNLYLLFGLHYANIHHKTHFTGIGNSLDGSTLVPVNNLLNSRSRFWGIGPQLGLEYTYHLPQTCWGVFSLTANMRAALLCSKTNASFHYSTLRTAGTEGVNLKNDHVWRVNPAFDARIGGSYDFCFCGYEGKLELGYEWVWYHNSINSITGYDVAFPGDSLDVYSNLSLHGPYLKVGVDF